MAKKILVIDDEPHIVQLLKSRLQANGYEVVAASNGKEGLERVEQENPDLIILDILMPAMDGYTFVRRLRKASREIPVIVLTGQGAMQDLFAVEGINDYMVKPFKAEELLEKIEKYIGKA
ncbi:MAG: response regulator [Candidatus Omnitrophica bacterium]|nr:response regulator [Candidatus Omnitrophota bacterium]